MDIKKIKRKKIMKTTRTKRVKTIKQLKSYAVRIIKERKAARSLPAENVTSHRSANETSSLFCEDNENMQDLKIFSEVREDYFQHLQTVVSDNCMFHDSAVAEETLKDLALELEQSALLACMQVDIYKKAMSNIIADIKKATEQRQVHNKVRRLLPNLAQQRTERTDNGGNELEIEVQIEVTATGGNENSSVNLSEGGGNENSSVNLSEGAEGYSRIPIISSIRNDTYSAHDSYYWAEQSGYNFDPYYGMSNDTSWQSYYESQNTSTFGEPWVEGGYYYPSMIDHCNYWNYNVPEIYQSNMGEFSAMEINDTQASVPQFNFSQVTEVGNFMPSTSVPIQENNQRCIPTLQSRKKGKKSVNQSSIKIEKIQKKMRDEQDRAQITKILQGEDSEDSVSDTENEEECSLMDRLEKMKDIFGIVDDLTPQDDPQEQGHGSRENEPGPSGIQSRSFWHCEKYIQLYNYFKYFKEMTPKQRAVKKRIFRKIFGTDCDEENPEDYMSEERYRQCCTERISAWIVKHLMPFYQQNRVLSRMVFKILGHHIANTIIDEVPYPDEWTVNYFVLKFFPPQMTYASEQDVFSFQLP